MANYYSLVALAHDGKSLFCYAAMVTHNDHQTSRAVNGDHDSTIQGVVRRRIGSLIVKY